MMKIYFTKYALAGGVQVIGEAQPSENYPSRVEWPRKYGHAFESKKHCQESEAEALKRVREMVASKRKSIAKQIAALDEIEAKLDRGELPMAEGVES